MPDGKRMEIDEATRTVIANNPGIRAKFLIEKVKKMTGCGRTAIYGHLTRLLNRREIYVAGKGNYWLEPPAGAGKRVEEEHTREIIAGLLVLAGRGSYTESGGIVPDPAKKEISSQHLNTGYPGISSLTENQKTVFLERVEQLIKSLKLRDERLKGYCKECEARLPRNVTSRKR